MILLEDRERIARELHDGAIQTLFRVGMSLQSTALISHQAEVTRRLEDSVSTVDQVIHDLRNYIFGLRPAALRLQGLDQALRRLIDEFERESGVSSVVDLDPAAADAISDKSSDVPQPATEALSNVRRHAHAETCRISLRLNGGTAVLQVEDDGQGFEPGHDNGADQGLCNFRERTAGQIWSMDVRMEARDRANWIDWLKVLAVLGVFYYHTALIFSATRWVINNYERSLVLSGIAGFGYLFGMPLSFCSPAQPAGTPSAGGARAISPCSGSSGWSQLAVVVDDEEQAPVDADRERGYQIGRLMAFSDGVFAIAITLLVLNVAVPEIAQSDAQSRLPAALLQTGPRLLTFALSFFLVGFYWILHHQLFRQLTSVNVWLLWLNLVVLFLVSLLPFSSGVVGRYYDTVIGAEVYVVNLAAIALAFSALYLYATRGLEVRPPPGALTGLVSRGFLWPLVVVALVMVLAPVNLIVAYVIGATLMAVVGIYTAVPRTVRSAPLRGTGGGRLRVSRPAARVAINGQPTLRELFRASFGGPQPTVSVTDNTVDIEYRNVGFFKLRRQSAQVTPQYPGGSRLAPPYRG